MQTVIAKLTYLFQLKIVQTALVGLVATAVDLAGLAILIQGFGWTPQMANVPSMIIPLCIQFFVNRHFVFKSSGNIYKQAVGYLATELISLGMVAVTFHFAVLFFPQHYAVVRMLCMTTVFLGISYPLFRLNFMGTKRAR